MMMMSIICKLSSVSKPTITISGRFVVAASKCSRLLSTQTAAAAAAATNKESPKPLSQMPGNWRGSLPIIGAVPLFIPYADGKSGGMRTEDFMRDNYNNYGKETGVCRFGPANERCIIVFDESFLEVLKHEGKYPTGILEGSWPIHQYNDKYVNGVKNPFLAKGEEWRSGRMAINPYLFNIQAAQSYLPAINQAAANACRKFEEYAVNGRLDRFCELAAFDMFLAASLDVQLNSAGGDPRGLEFANKIIGALSAMSNLPSQCPYSKYDMLKFKTWNKFVDEWRVGREASQELVELAMEREHGKGVMHGFLRNQTNVSEEEATEMNLILTFAAADTTSSLINNVLTNLSRHPRIQDEVRAEMMRELQGQDYNANVKLKYFEQVLKETQRLTPSLPWVNVKYRIPNDLMIGGYLVPEGTTVVFSHMGIANDETFAGPEPSEFRPERFSDESIAARKGTRAEFLDHPICSKPFGYGARMCVGSRIAKLEYTSLLCRILQDYKLEYDADNSAPSIRLTLTTTTEQPCPKFNITNLHS